MHGYRQSNGSVVRKSNGAAIHGEGCTCCDTPCVDLDCATKHTLCTGEKYVLHRAKVNVSASGSVWTRADNEYSEYTVSFDFEVAVNIDRIYLFTGPCGTATGFGYTGRKVIDNVDTGTSWSVGDEAITGSVSNVVVNYLDSDEILLDHLSTELFVKFTISVEPDGSARVNLLLTVSAIYGKANPEAGPEENQVFQLVAGTTLLDVDIDEGSVNLCPGGSTYDASAALDSAVIDGDVNSVDRPGRIVTGSTTGTIEIVPLAQPIASEDVGCIACPRVLELEGEFYLTKFEGSGATGPYRNRYYYGFDADLPDQPLTADLPSPYTYPAGGTEYVPGEFTARVVRTQLQAGEWQFCGWTGTGTANLWNGSAFVSVPIKVRMFASLRALSTDSAMFITDGVVVLINRASDDLALGYIEAKWDGKCPTGGPTAIRQYAYVRDSNVYMTSNTLAVSEGSLEVGDTPDELTCIICGTCSASSIALNDGTSTHVLNKTGDPDQCAYQDTAEEGYALQYLPPGVNGDGGDNPTGCWEAASFEANGVWRKYCTSPGPAGTYTKVLGVGPATVVVS